PAGVVRRRRPRDGRPAGGTAHGDSAQGVPRADVPGDRGSAGLPVEHGEDAVVSGPVGVETTARATAGGGSQPSQGYLGEGMSPSIVSCSLQVVSSEGCQ